MLVSQEKYLFVAFVSKNNSNRNRSQIMGIKKTFFKRQRDDGDEINFLLKKWRKQDQRVRSKPLQRQLS